MLGITTFYNLRNRGRWIALMLSIIAVVFLILLATPGNKTSLQKYLRTALFNQFRPVSLKNCQFELYGDGYVMCRNLLGGIESAYSYGIAGTDQWGCDISKNYGANIHQYDCFDTRRPSCMGAAPEYFHFNEECIGGKEELIENRPYGTFANHINKNGDTGKKILVKMDVEGSEWEALQETSDETLANIDQLAVEFHDVSKNLFSKLLLAHRLKKTFYIVNVHFNNHACAHDIAPFPAWAFQVQFVNKRIGVLDQNTRPEAFKNPLNTPDYNLLPDCQAHW